MATMYENYSSAQETWSTLDSTNDRSCQTFTTTSAHDVGAVKLWLYHGNNPGNITVELKATDGAGKPTGAALASGIILEANIPSAQGSATWVEVIFSSAYSAADATKYAVVLSAPSSSATKVLYIGRSTADGGYSGGQIGLSIDGGSTWTMADSPDLLFQVYDEASYVFSPPSDLITYKRLVAAAANTIWYESI